MQCIAAKATFVQYPVNRKFYITKHLLFMAGNHGTKVNINLHKTITVIDI